jgi:hypothetical protein
MTESNPTGEWIACWFHPDGNCLVDLKLPDGRILVGMRYENGRLVAGDVEFAEWRVHRQSASERTFRVFAKRLRQWATKTKQILRMLRTGNVFMRCSHGTLLIRRCSKCESFLAQVQAEVAPTFVERPGE